MTDNTLQVKYTRQGEYVKRKPDAAKVYRRGEYDRATNRFSLVDCEDTSREIFVKADALVTVGFDY